ncbi:MAG TPA: DNA-processing protein DprA [Cyclobacteriaceae bacterium]|nr:DNA-processing protein DprA [Cyclobacteriaceae bacterium]HMV08885.1 DNA-processing protein DprA [Cyclobacteriaceae bacterium]HMV89310.1 DNA-processing protein DprA [Cyclobacteriaceae bacterium]HMX00360.1 DNA-processing protein DprA [Cyclobacteriaceae bacterium]HMX49641.1 DNA-processing protein DprA [Cyclobacteriaceae bacterium]
MDQNRLSLLALHFIDGVGDYVVKQVVSYTGSAEKVFKTPKGKLMQIPGVGEVTAQAILNGKPFERAEKELRKAEKESVELVFYMDKKYPSRLKNIPDAPSILYLKGTIDFENPRTVAIVGTRQATEYGKERVEEIVRDLASHQPLIVSGLAYGIDIHAHKQAVKHGLPTVGVMGSGMDRIYPSAHKETAKKMFELGGLLTESPFGTKPDAHNFPQRNRIIAGLCDALLVIEAAEKGGALITAEIANSYNKDVFACPGSVGETYSAGCNNLIKSNKANLLTSVKDIEYIMGWDAAKPQKKKVSVALDGYDANEQTVLKVMIDKKANVLIDELSWKSNLPVSQLASVLLGLEFKGVVKSMPGKQYSLAG